MASLFIRQTIGLIHSFLINWIYLSYKGKDVLVNKANKIGVTEAFIHDMVFKGVAAAKLIELTARIGEIARNH